MLSTNDRRQGESPALHHMSDNLAGKTLLILAGADPHRKVVNAAHDLGVKVIVADYLPIEEAPAKQIADEAWLVDVFDVDTLVRKCKMAHVDGVLNLCLDAPQLPYQRICERLGLPCYGTLEQFRILGNKKAFKAYCAEHGILTIPSYSENRVASGNVEYPLFIKPSDSRGSRGQAVCHDRSDVDSALKAARAASRAGEVVIERYLGGYQDFSISCFILGGEVYPMKLGDRFLGSKADGLDRQHVCTISPTAYLDTVFEATFPRVRRFVSDLGIQFGFLYLQGFIDGGEVYCYDPGLRMPGSDFDLVVRDVTGFDAMKSAINYALTGDIESCFGDPRDAYLLDGGLGVILSLPVRPGLIAEINGVDTVMADARFHGVSLRHKAGDRIRRTGDTRQRALEFVAYIHDRAELASLFEFVYDNVTIIDNYGMDMTVSRASYDGNRIDVR